MGTLHAVTAVADRVKRNDAMKGLARTGLAGHGVLFVLVGVVALLLAFGKSSGEADQSGALQQLARHTGGWLVLLLIAIGLSAYALWQLVQTATGPVGAKDEAKQRISCGIRGVVYAGLAVSAWKVVADGRTKSQAGSQEAVTAKVMAHSGGRWLIGLAGLVVIGIGVYLVYESITTKFEDELDLSSATPRTRTSVVFLGRWGGVARGVVTGVAGVLLLVAAIRFDPNKARGIDGALRALRDTAFGPWLLVVFALGLILFGLFGVSEAKYRRLDG